MKLTTKAILYFLLVSIPLLIVAAFISYFTIKRMVNENLNEEIWNKKRKAEALINSFKEPREVFFSLDSLSSIKVDTTNGTGYKKKYLFKMDAEENEQMVFWQLKSYYRSKGVNYLITVTEPKFENDDLVENLSNTFLITFILLVISFFIVNWVVSKKLWKPFNNTIQQLKNYDIKNHKEFLFETTSTKEFKELNDAVKKMTGKAYSDFIAQKEFTENASHESQTPLAVIKARLDLLMQSSNLKENEMEQLQVIESAVSKLSSLNKGLLLLAKIGNNQFRETEDINVSTAIDKMLILYEEMTASKNISVSKSGKDLKVKLNPALCDILVSNLIQNAIRHNSDNGKIVIETSDQKLAIKNTGEPLKIAPERIFDRFKKNDDSKESLGLGLALVKSIADACHYKITYAYSDRFHIFTIQF